MRRKASKAALRFMGAQGRKLAKSAANRNARREGRRIERAMKLGI